MQFACFFISQCVAIIDIFATVFPLWTLCTRTGNNTKAWILGPQFYCKGTAKGSTEGNKYSSNFLFSNAKLPHKGLNGIAISSLQGDVIQSEYSELLEPPSQDGLDESTCKNLIQEASKDNGTPVPFMDATDPNNKWFEKELIDKCKILAVGGRGGNGCVSFRREKHVPLGGADGGNGGPGGSVYLVCDDTMSNLNHVRQFYVYKAENGKHGLGERQNGAKGRDRYIYVPPGTHVYSLQGELYASLEKRGDRLMVVRGGRGGKGNRYYKTKFNVAPKICELGEAGIEREVVLNYKIVGNVALIGKPNSGKSSILRCLTRARPRVAGFAFSTRFPIMGVMEIDSNEVQTDNMAMNDSTETKGNQSHACADSTLEKADSDTYDSGPLNPSEDEDIYDSETYLEDDYNDSIMDPDIDYPSDSQEGQWLTSDGPCKDLEQSTNDNTGDKLVFHYSYRQDLFNQRTEQLNTDAGNTTPMLPKDVDSIISDIHVKDVSCSNLDLERDTTKAYNDDRQNVSTLESHYDTSAEEYEPYETSDDDCGTYDDSDYDVNGAFETIEYDHQKINHCSSNIKRQLVIADVPGLIKGANEGRGLGYKFLKHIENSNVLAYVVDASLEEPLGDYIDVKREVELFNISLLSRLELILLNKLDLIEREHAKELVDLFISECGHNRVYALSAKTRENLEDVRLAFAHIYQDPMKKEPQRPPFDLSIDRVDDFRKLNPRKFKVHKLKDGEFRISSAWLERKIPMMRFDQRETLDKLRRILRINRIHYRLKRMGVKQGDVVHIGESSFCIEELAY